MNTIEEAPVGVAVEQAGPARISAVIVNWNTGDLLERCLRSIEAHGDGLVGEVIVVDNASTDDSTERVRTNWPTVRLICNPENLGYQRANNIGMAAARGEHLLLINSDAFLTQNALARMLAGMDDPKCGVVGPRLEYGDGAFQRWTAGCDPDLGSAAVWALSLDRLFPRSGVYLGDDVRTAFNPDWVSSACLLLRARAYQAVGPMDEDYFAYMDDVDYCRRLRTLGWGVWYEPAARVVHLMGASTKGEAGAASPLAVQSFNRYFAERHGAGAERVLRLFQTIGFGGRALAYTVAATVIPGRRARYRRAATRHRRHVAIVVGLSKHTAKDPTPRSKNPVANR